MPRPKSSVPKYSLFKPSGLACVYINRRRIYLGKYGSAESRRKYRELIHQFTSTAEPQPQVVDGAPLSLNELCWEFVQQKLPTFKPSETGESKEASCYRLVIRILREMFGESAAVDFGPRKLRMVRDEMIAKGWARSFINKQMIRLRAIFRFGVSWELLPFDVAEALKSVPGLRAGETKARETVRREAIPQDRIDAVKVRLRQRNRDLIDLLLHTGARPKELLSLRTCDLVRTGATWRADLSQHKNAHRGQSRTLWFGPQAQLILCRYLRADDQTARLFPVRVHTLSQSIKSACDRAKVPRFTAYYLRHTAATRIRDALGIEHAQALLGHRTVNMTAHYSEKAERHAQEAAHQFG